MIDFMQDLIIFTGGAFCIIFWLAVIMIVGIELWDVIFPESTDNEEKSP